MRVLLLGGTSDAREMAGVLAAAGHQVLLSVLTEYGAALAQAGQVGESGAASATSASVPALPAAAAPSSAGISVRTGRLEQKGLEALLADIDVVVDATHPFATQISALAVHACAEATMPYVRFERPADELHESVLMAADADEAARLAVERAAGGTIFTTVGSRTLEAYVAAARAAGVRLVARVLPVVESLARCRHLGLEPADLVAMQGPTTTGLDYAMLRHFGATVLVTKASGGAGGVAAKLEAAEAAGVTSIVVGRPEMPRDEPASGPVVSTAADLVAGLEHLNEETDEQSDGPAR